MADGKRSELTGITLLIADAMWGDIHTIAETLSEVPFMQEEIGRGEYQRRFRAMNPQQRLDEMRRIGTSEVLRLMGGTT